MGSMAPSDRYDQPKFSRTISENPSTSPSPPSRVKCTSPTSTSPNQKKNLERKQGAFPWRSKTSLKSSSTTIKSLLWSSSSSRPEIWTKCRPTSSESGSFPAATSCGRPLFASQWSFCCLWGWLWPPIDVKTRSPTSRLTWWSRLIWTGVTKSRAKGSWVLLLQKNHNSNQDNLQVCFTLKSRILWIQAKTTQTHSRS